MNVHFSAGEVTKKPTAIKPVEVFTMQSMPAGCFVVGHVEADSEYPESIGSIDSVLFMATCKFAHSEKALECYGIQDSSDRAIKWRLSEDVEVYFYGPYKNTCELIGEIPLPFMEWYQKVKGFESEFDLPIKLELNESLQTQ